jgi:hypothetical protein
LNNITAKKKPAAYVLTCVIWHQILNRNKWIWNNCYHFTSIFLLSLVIWTNHIHLANYWFIEIFRGSVWEFPLLFTRALCNFLGYCEIVLSWGKKMVGTKKMMKSKRGVDHFALLETSKFPRFFLQKIQSNKIATLKFIIKNYHKISFKKAALKLSNYLI